MLIFVDQISERLVYTMHFVFEEHGLSAQLTNDRVFFEQATGLKLNYSSWNIPDAPQLLPANLLFEEQLNPDLTIEKTVWEGMDCLAIDEIIDPFAAIFYIISRYEEYNYPVLDKHGRFEAKNSILFKYNWLQLQIVERWVRAIMVRFAPSLMPQFDAEKWHTFVPTFDIDNTFAFQWKEGWRTWLSTAKDLMQRNKSRRIQRKKVQSGVETDPFDCFDFLNKVARKHPETRLFWLLGDFAEHDKNISWSDPRHQALIQSFDPIARVGLHPSYASNTSEIKLAQETDRLSHILGAKPLESRQHYLKLAIPHTYRRLISLGFHADFSMGYAEEFGFRAGTARPFNFFDLERNKDTNYKVFPFVYMDGTLLEYKAYDIETAKRVIALLAEEVKRYGGNFCCIWHNETIAEAGKWKGWGSVFEFTMEQFT